MCRQALGLALVSSVLLLAGCMSVESGLDNKQPNPDNQGCPGCYGRTSPPPTVASLQDAYGRPYPIAAPYAYNPPPNNWTAQKMLNTSRPLTDMEIYSGTMMAMNPTGPQGGAGANGGFPPMPVPKNMISPRGMGPVPGMPPSSGLMQAGGANPAAGGMNPYAASGIQQAQYANYPPGRGYPPSGGYPPPGGWPAQGQYPYPAYNPYPSYYNPYPGYTYPPTTTGAPGQMRPGYDLIQKTQFSPTTSGNYVPPAAPFNVQGASPFYASGGMGAMPTGGAGGWCPPSTVGGMRTQIRFVRPVGMNVSWYTMGADGRPYYFNGIRVPGNYNFTQGAIYRLKLTNIDERPELEVYPTLEVMAGTSKTEAFLSHSAVPLEFTSEDFKQIVEGNYVVKVIYLPDPQFQDAAGTGTDEILSTRLEPGADPIQAARQKGTVLLVIRMGNVKQELDNTPPLNAPGRSSASGPPGCPPNMPYCPPGSGPGMGAYGNPGYGGGGFGPGFGLGGYAPGGPPTSMQRQLIQVPMEGSGVAPRGQAGNANPQNCQPGVFPGQPCPPGMAPYGAPGYGAPAYGPGYSNQGNPGAPTASAPRTPQETAPRTLPQGTNTSLPVQPPAGANNDMPATLPPPDLHETKSSPVNPGPEQKKPTAAQPTVSAPGSQPSSEVPSVLPETTPSPGSLQPPPPGTAEPSDPPVTVPTPNGTLTGPPREKDDAPATPPMSNDKTTAPGESARPMGTPETKIPEPPSTLPPSQPGAPSVPQTLQPTPGLSDVVPPTPAPAPSAPEAPKGIEVPAIPGIPMAPSLAPMATTEQQPAKTPIFQDMTPAFPDTPAPILPAPTDAPKFPAGEPVGRPSNISPMKIEQAPSTPAPVDLPKVPAVDPVPPSPPSGSPATKIEQPPVPPVPPVPADLPKIPAVDPVQPSPPSGNPATKIDQPPSLPVPADLPMIPAVDPPPAPSGDPGPMPIPTTGSAPQKTEAPPAVPTPSPLTTITGEPPLALTPAPPVIPTPTSEPPLALPPP